MGIVGAKSLSGDLRKGWAVFALGGYGRLLGRYAALAAGQDAGSRNQVAPATAGVAYSFERARYSGRYVAIGFDLAAVPASIMLCWGCSGAGATTKAITAEISEPTKTDLRFFDQLGRCREEPMHR